MIRWSAYVKDCLVLTDLKVDSYDLILVIIDRLRIMVYYKLVKITIDTPGLAKVIINVVVRYHGLTNLIVTDRVLLFILKF